MRRVRQPTRTFHDLIAVSAVPDGISPFPNGISPFPNGISPFPNETLGSTDAIRAA